MTNPTNLRRHADLVDRMATTLGLDLEEITIAGQLQIDTLGEAVMACTGCTNADGCERWLEMQTKTAPAAPGMCRNSDLFERLKAGRFA
ncbi:DUF6455 family protein [uncultured Roseovarius sp.]|uniref:DUF6455 family protein n=1 Tax=uncultured Roseovarius sp. TaxID=293344 RepID=UPI002638342D|nr:DUF6455 family protein [uncultured Roseovarius sp.]